MNGRAIARPIVLGVLLTLESRVLSFKKGNEKAEWEGQMTYGLRWGDVAVSEFGLRLESNEERPPTMHGGDGL